MANSNNLQRRSHQAAGGRHTNHKFVSTPLGTNNALSCGKQRRHSDWLPLTTPLVLWSHLVKSVAHTLSRFSQSRANHLVTCHKAHVIVSSTPRCKQRSHDQHHSHHANPADPQPPSARQSSSSVLLLVFNLLLLLPNLSHTLRVPYRYPHYPLFNKELLQGSSGKSVCLLVCVCVMRH